MNDLNTVLPNGTFGMAVSLINDNFSLIVNAINSLEYASTKSKGIHNYGFVPSTTTIPNAVSGDWCMVLREGNTFPADIWTYNGTSWTKGGTWTPEGIDLTDYATKTELNAAVANSVLQATALVGYYQCTVSGTTLAVTAPGFTLPAHGGNIRIKMSAPATGASKLNINGTGAKALLYNGLAVSSANTWEQNEIISVFYDGTRFMASNSLGGNGAKIGLDTYFTVGKIEIDNDNSQFIVTENIVGYPDGAQYRLEKNTVIPFSFAVGRIQCGVMDTTNNTIVFKNWNMLTNKDSIIFSVEVVDGKVVGVINSLIPIYFKGYSKDFVVKARLLQKEDGTQLSNLYINATSRRWASTNTHADTSFAFQLKKGELVRIESNALNGVSCCLLKDLDGITAGSDARIINGYTYFSNNAKDVLYLVPPRDCYLYVLNYTTNASYVRYPDSIRTIGSNSDIASDTKHSFVSKSMARKLSGSFYINATTLKWVSNANAEVYFFALEKDDVVTIEANSQMDASIAFIKPINKLTCVGDSVEYATPYTSGVMITQSTKQTFNISEDCLLYVFYNGSAASAQNRFPSGIYLENRNPSTLSVPNLDYLLNSLYRYNGETLKFSPNTFGRRRIATLPAWGNYKDSKNGKGLHQGMAVYDNYICLFTYSTTTPAVVKVGLFDLPTATLLSTITLPYSSYARPHGNALSFGRTYHSSNSVVPLLYISQWEADSERGVLVYDIVLNGSTYSANLVQAIIPSNIDGNIFGNGHADWVVDADNGHLYSVTYGMAGDDAPYTQDDTTNPTAICKFAIPSVSSTVETLVTTNDIIEHFKTASLPFRQGVCVCNGKMMIQRGLESGDYTQWLETVFVNLASKTITTKIPLVPFGGEPEGIAVYNSHLVMGWRNDANIYQFEFS